MLRKLFRKLEIRSKIKDIDRDLRAVEWERSIMLARCNYKRAEAMKQIVSVLNAERRELDKELRSWATTKTTTTS